MSSKCLAKIDAVELLKIVAGAYSQSSHHHLGTMWSYWDHPPHLLNIQTPHWDLRRAILAHYNKWRSDTVSEVIAGKEIVQ